MRERPKSRCYGDNSEVLWWLEPETELEAWQKEYSSECDRLAELEAVKAHRKHWGRWYLTGTSLVTRISQPRVGEDGSIRGGAYYIGLDRLNEDWLSHMGRKNWVGEKGLADLVAAMNTLTGLCAKDATLSQDEEVINGRETIQG